MNLFFFRCLTFHKSVRTKEKRNKEKLRQTTKQRKPNKNTRHIDTGKERMECLGRDLRVFLFNITEWFLHSPSVQEPHTPASLFTHSWSPNHPTQTHTLTPALMHVHIWVYRLHELKWFIILAYQNACVHKDMEARQHRHAHKAIKFSFWKLNKDVLSVLAIYIFFLIYSWSDLSTLYDA